jgi:peptidoglycan/xylan/chitin deacetylase (PgdA/CDA1 family)
MKVSITVDVENDLGFLESRFGIDEGLPVILSILKKSGIKGTFFVSGDSLNYLQKIGLLREIDSDGHEIGSHGYRHTDYRQWEFARICDEVRKSKHLLEDAVQKDIIGYRAPQFLMNGSYFRAVQESGFLYDSSIPDPNGISAARILRKVCVDSHLLKVVAQSGVREFVINSVPILNVPHGLLWINLISLELYKRLFHYQINDLNIFYLHPFDMVPEKNRIALDFKRKLFYLKNCNNIGLLLNKLVLFWKSENVDFIRLGDLIAEKKDRS